MRSKCLVRKITQSDPSPQPVISVVYGPWKSLAITIFQRIRLNFGCLVRIFSISESSVLENVLRYSSHIFTHHCSLLIYCHILAENKVHDLQVVYKCAVRYTNMYAQFHCTFQCTSSLVLTSENAENDIQHACRSDEKQPCKEEQSIPIFLYGHICNHCKVFVTADACNRQIAMANKEGSADAASTGARPARWGPCGDPRTPEGGPTACQRDSTWWRRQCSGHSSPADSIGDVPPGIMLSDRHTTYPASVDKH